MLHTNHLLRACAVTAGADGGVVFNPAAAAVVSAEYDDDPAVAAVGIVTAELIEPLPATPIVAVVAVTLLVEDVPTTLSTSRIT
jgi:hypothetical protein